MGQNVEIRDTVTVGDVLLIDTDRSFTGQDGHVITPNSPGYAFPGRLAEGLFALGLGIDHIFVLQNTISVRRSSGWDDESVSAATDVTNTFLRYYPDDEEE